MTEDEIREMTKGIQICWCNTLIEQLDGGGYSYWLHVDRGRIERDHAAIPAVLPWTVEELKLILNGLHAMSENFADIGSGRLADKVEIEIDRRDES